LFIFALHAMLPFLANKDEYILEHTHVKAVFGRKKVQ